MLCEIKVTLVPWKNWLLNWFVPKNGHLLAQYVILQSCIIKPMCLKQWADTADILLIARYFSWQMWEYLIWIKNFLSVRNLLLKKTYREPEGGENIFTLIFKCKKNRGLKKNIAILQSSLIFAKFPPLRLEADLSTKFFAPGQVLIDHRALFLSPANKLMFSLSARRPESGSHSWLIHFLLGRSRWNRSCDGPTLITDNYHQH